MHSDEVDAKYRELRQLPDGNCMRCRLLVAFGVRGEVIQPAVGIGEDGDPYCEAHLARGNLDEAVRRRQREERVGRPS